MKPSFNLSGAMISAKDFIPAREKINAFLEEEYRGVDRFMDYCTIGYFLFGLLLIGFNSESWKVAFIMGGINLGVYYLFKLLFSGMHLYRYMSSMLLGLFVIQFLVQMKGNFYFHIAFLVGNVILLFYQHWRILMPYFAVMLTYYLFAAYLLQSGDTEARFYFINQLNLTRPALVFSGLVSTGQFFLSCLLAIHLRKRLLGNARNTIYLNDQLNIEGNIRLANQIAYGILDEDYQPKENDLMGKTLINMRNSLREYREQEARNRWINEGIAHISEVLMAHNEIEKLSYEILYHVVKYIKASQGTLFVVEEQNRQTFLQMTACYAHENQENFRHKVEPGENLIGESALRQQTIHIKQVPDDYLRISSGMGGGKPSQILIVPLKIKDQTVGVIELATFNAFRDYEIEFMEKLAERIATSVLTVKSNQKNNELLQEAQILAEQLRAQEDMLRQSMEEIQVTQDEVMRSNDKLNALLSNVPGMVFIQRKKAGKWGIEFATSGAKDLTGFEPHELMEGRVSYLDLMHPDDRSSKELDEKVGQALSERKIYEIRYRIIDAHGKLKWVWEKGNGVYENDEVVGLEGFITDITDEVTSNQKIQEQLEEMKAQEELIRQNMEELAAIHEDLAHKNYDYNQLMELMDIATIISEFNNNGTILNVNKNFTDLTGYTREELVGKPHTTYVPAHVVASSNFKDLWTKLSAGEYVQQEVERMKKNGDPFWLRSIYFPLKNESGQVKRVFAVNFDITIQKLQEIEKQRTMEELHRIQEELNHKTAELTNFRNAIDRSVIVIEFDKKAHFLYVNDKFCKASGYAANEVTGKHHSFYIPKDVMDSGQFEELWQHLLTGEYLEKEVRRLRKDGSDLWLRIYYVPIKDEHDQLIKISCICSDITFEKQQKEKMNQLGIDYQEMALLLKKREEELVEKTRELEKIRKEKRKK